MTVNLLSQRLKAVKRELTALKTAHMRGLGLVETYRYTGYIEYQSGLSTLKFNIDFSNDYAAYPFFQIMPYGGIGSSDWILGGMSATYYNNGYSVEISLPEALGFFYSNYYILALSPIENVTAAWS